ncbi:MAG: glycosyltransferase family 2 protein [Sedimentisphaerales bacterium]
MPKISVIIPTYNSNGLVKETLCSVLAQTESDLEIIVVDDGSTDDTHSLVESLSDNRVNYFYKTTGGPASARNFGLSKANGDYVAFLDHDDLWPVNYLAVMSADLEKHTEFGLAYSPITVRYPDGRQIESYKAPKGKSGWLAVELFKRGFVWTSAALIRRSVLKNFYYDELLRTSYEDGDFFLRLATRTQFLFVPWVEAIRREHTKNLSSEAGVLPTRIMILERFYFRLGGDKVVPAKIAKRKLSHATRKVAEARRLEKCRSAAITLYRRAIRYRPLDIRLYIGLGQALLLSKKNDKMHAWRMPEPLADVAG